MPVQVLSSLPHRARAVASGRVNLADMLEQELKIRGFAELELPPTRPGTRPGPGVAQASSWGRVITDSALSVSESERDPFLRESASSQASHSASPGPRPPAA